MEQTNSPHEAYRTAIRLLGGLGCLPLRNGLCGDLACLVERDAGQERTDQLIDEDGEEGDALN